MESFGASKAFLFAGEKERTSVNREKKRKSIKCNAIKTTIL